MIITLTYTGRSESRSLDFTIAGLRREMIEGRPYPIELRIVNLSTDTLGVPVQAALEVGMVIDTPTGFPIPPQVSRETLLPAEERTLEYTLEIPLDVIKQEGSFSAQVVSPAGESLAIAGDTILLEPEVLVLSVSYYDNLWYSFLPEVDNPLMANNENVWVGVGLSGCVVGKDYRLRVTTPRGTHSVSARATEASPYLQLQVPTKAAGTEVWTIKLYDVDEGNYMFWEASYNMVVSEPDT